ncbi:TIGR01777 family oxidoreductase [Sporosarcina ureilytica]|uniref:TIGR01777 family protein n=1 Tax=Sporosarcina ureilytica TaxID=298596 RepID=A0A1D8JDQ8_9BACL|nr:TIGR01777 family oxidoreductase [Sporosarcina ureilytica]AOV06834.1 TIGR01777 family protein [Sporosarcina ureilytica]
MKIVIAGGSGFIGQKLTNFLVQLGHEVMILTRNKSEQDAKISFVQWLQPGNNPEKEIGYADVFINLAGVSINHGRWTSVHHNEIYASRITATQELLRIIQHLPKKPHTLINASAIGIYPTSETAIYTENSKAIASDFLGKTVHDWEQLALTAENNGVRVACMRFGVVLGKEGGALPPIVLPYKLYAGGTVGSGKQWLSWVHIDDLIRSVEFAMINEDLHGPINVTAPFPKRMAYFGKTVGVALNRPHWLPVPAFALQLLLGKKSKLVLEGQYVSPNKLQDNGFKFLYPTLESALNNLLNNH